MEKENKDSQTTVAGSTPSASVGPTLADTIESSCIDGLSGGIALFIVKRKLGQPADDKARKFAGRMTAEFATDEAERSSYPLKGSIAKKVNDALHDSRSVFHTLWEVGEVDNLRKVIRLIVAGEMLNVFQDELDTVIKIYNES